MTYAAIIGVGSFLPERRLTNKDLERIVDTSDEWIFTRTGIRERRIIADDDATSDLAARAGTAALADAGLKPADVDLLIVATTTPDHIFPSTACLAQEKMGLSCPSYDIQAACTGFIFGLQAAAAAIESGRSRTVLLIGADALTRHVDFTNRATCVLFGDGAGAFLLQASDRPGVLGVDLGSDGSGADVLGIHAGGTAAPATVERVEAGEHFIFMNGTEVFKFAVRVIPTTMRAALEASNLTVDDLTWLVPHQANQRILDTIADRLGIAHERVVTTIAETGNTSTASIPIAVQQLVASGSLHPGETLGLVGFGAGLTWGAAVVQWTKEAS